MIIDVHMILQDIQYGLCKCVQQADCSDEEMEHERFLQQHREMPVSGTIKKVLYPSNQSPLPQVKSQTATKIESTHTTPVKKYVDDQTFDLSATSSSTCVVKVSFLVTAWPQLCNVMSHDNSHLLITMAMWEMWNCCIIFSST